MKFYFYFLMGCLIFNPVFASEKGAKIGAYLRVKDEINTIEACLNSIDGVFDHIVIIHSNEPDDGSVAVMQKWCADHDGCEIHEYPHAVIPSHDVRYTTNEYRPENTLAAYYEFGLQFFDPDEWVVKIDGDQIYLTDQLKKNIDYIRRQHKTHGNTHFGMKGYNTYPSGGRFVKYKIPHNGGPDSFAVRRDHIGGFGQQRFYEAIQLKNIEKQYVFPNLTWFHFLKNLKSGGQVRSADQAFPDEKINLTPDEKKLYESHILPLLKSSNSPYQFLKY